MSRLPDLAEPFEYQWAARPARGQSARRVIHVSRPVPRWPDDRFPPLVPLCGTASRLATIADDWLHTVDPERLCPRCAKKLAQEATA